MIADKCYECGAPVALSDSPRVRCLACARKAEERLAEPMQASIDIPRYLKRHDRGTLRREGGRPWAMK